jgi:DNA-directed RNA polymerase specialized sigma24 family protein
VTDIVAPVDNVVAELLRGGGQNALDAVFDYYAEELYDYSLTFLDPESAADAVHDALLVAMAWAGKLEHHEQFGLWLFALVRNECLRVLRRGGGSPAVHVGAHSADASRVHNYSSDGNGSGLLREVYDLVHRHGFQAREIATVLGVSPGRAQSLRDRSETKLGGGRRVITPSNVVPRPVLPAELRNRVLSSAAVPSRVAYRGELAEPRRRSGFPVPLDRIEEFKRVRVMRTAAILLTMLAVGGAALVIPQTARHNVIGLLRWSSPTTESPRVTLPPSGSPSRGGANGSPAPATSPSSPSWSPLPDPASNPTGQAGGAITGIGGKCINSTDSAGSAGSALELLTCNGTAAQRWAVAPNDTLLVLGKCMTVRKGGTTNGTEVQLENCDSSDGQKWQQREGALYNPRSDKCLEAPGLDAQDAIRLVIWACSGAENQRWNLPAA